MLEHIYICRHGFRSNWIDPTIKTGPTGMSRDPPLAAYGLTQATALSEFLTNPASTHPYPIPELVFSSPFYRCIQTSEPTCRALREKALASKVGGDVEGVDVELVEKQYSLKLEHGVQEWYSPVNPQTGLHPRPGSPKSLTPHFPPNLIDTSYTSTLYPSRRGENLKELQDRADLFIETWTARIESEWPKVKTVVVFGHAASIIVLGRALTGDKSLSVRAGCASVSLYTRKKGNMSEMIQSEKGLVPCGVGMWDIVWNGKADFLVNGLERDWSFKDAVIKDGEVINDDGDHAPHPPEHEIPTGLAPGMDQYLRRGRPPPNISTAEAAPSAIVEPRM